MFSTGDGSLRLRSVLIEADVLSAVTGDARDLVDQGDCGLEA
jgi:hypothetical protein